MDRALEVLTEVQDKHQPELLSVDFSLSNEPLGTREGSSFFKTGVNVSSLFSPKSSASAPRLSLPYPVLMGDEIPSPSSTTPSHWDLLKETTSTDSHSPHSQSSEASTSSSEALGPPSLSPSYTESSLESISVRTPTDGLSPTSFSFAPHKTFMDQIPMSFTHPLPSEDALINAPDTWLDFDFGDLGFSGSFFQVPEQSDDSSRRRVTYKAVEVHEKVMQQVAPYTVQPPPPKNDKGKAKAKAKAKTKASSSTGPSEGSDGFPEPSTNADGNNSAAKKKKKRNEEVRCEVDGCTGT
ncbi:hypothetical protein H0H92_012525, partial [Tricholoma furcatifolium]